MGAAIFFESDSVAASLVPDGEQVQPDLLKDNPEWYNEVTRNCTTTINRQLGADVHSKQPWDYRYLLHGTLDELHYDRGRLVTGGLTFPELKQREHINAAGKAAGLSPDYSTLIRAGRIGF